MKIAPKLRNFLWRLLSWAVDTADNLRRRNIQVNEYCIRCITEHETTNHVLFTCIHAAIIWRGSGIPYTILGDPDISIEEKIRFLLNTYNDSNVEKHIRYLPFWILWRLWKSRNNMLFNHKTEKAIVTLENTIDDTNEWIGSQSDVDDNITRRPPQHGHLDK